MHANVDPARVYIPQFEALVADLETAEANWSRDRETAIREILIKHGIFPTSIAGE